jgi:hypothetical protein
MKHNAKTNLIMAAKKHRSVAHNDHRMLARAAALRDAFGQETMFVQDKTANLAITSTSPPAVVHKEIVCQVFHSTRS